MLSVYRERMSKGNDARVDEFVEGSCGDKVIMTVHGDLEVGKFIDNGDATSTCMEKIVDLQLDEGVHETIHILTHGRHAPFTLFGLPFLVHFFLVS